MSRSSSASSPSRRKPRLLMLSDASQYSQWKQSVQAYFFKQFKNVNMDALTTADTLDEGYFKKEFPTEHKTAGKDDAGQKQHAFADDAFLAKCSEHALLTGEGFNDWLYDTFSDLRASLSEDINDSTSAVRIGDLIGLLDAIKLAVQHFELFDPTDLELEHARTTMANEGRNDVLKYVSKLQEFMNRLQAAGHPVADARAQRILLRGLNQDVFDPFIRDAERRPYPTYATLKKALLKEAAGEKMLAKLRALKPGVDKGIYAATRSHTRPATRAADPPSPGHTEHRIARIEQTLSTLATRNDCFQFQRTGRCSRGDACRFAHGGTSKRGRTQHEARDDPAKRRRTTQAQSTDHAGADNGSSASQSGHPTRFCTFHMGHRIGCAHNTADCRDLQARPKAEIAEYMRMDALMRKVRGGAAAVHSTTGADPADLHFTLVSRATMPAHVLACADRPKIDKWAVDGCSTVHATYDRARCINIRSKCTVISGADSAHQFTATEVGDCPIQLRSKEGKMLAVLLTDVVISTHFPFHILSEIVVFDKMCTAEKKKGSWQFRTPDSRELFHASQHLLGAEATHASSIYFVDTVDAAPRATGAPAFDAPPHGAVVAAVKPRTAKELPASAKLNPTRARRLLAQMHLDQAHRNIRSIARQHGIPLPDPLPECWACLFAKPRSIAHDQVSTRVVTRVLEGVAADAKGPIQTPTPEGFKYFFLIVDLFSHTNWLKLAKSQSEWPVIWEAFVKYAEAKTGRTPCIAYVITDGHKVHTQRAVADFNADRGIQGVTTAPYSQWQDPAERHIGAVTESARACLIHGGGHDWMWGWAVRHSAAALNATPPPKPIEGHEGKSRQRIVDPSITGEKELRVQRPFLCLAIMKLPPPKIGSNFKARAQACLHLMYEPSKKSYAMLTYPDLELVYSVEVRHCPLTFPLRNASAVDDALQSLDVPDSADIARALSGPHRLSQHAPLGPSDSDAHAALPPSQLSERRQNTAPGWSSTRGYRPSAAALESLASVHAALSLGPEWVCSASTTRKLYTPDELARRVPRTTKQALTCPDKAFWLPGILKDFAVMRAKNCIADITTERPEGPAPPRLEQRFKIKYREAAPIALEDLPGKAWKARTVARGDKFKQGEHFDRTAAPVVHTPTLKMMLAWGVQTGCKFYEHDETAAFYGNEMDVKGVVVQLCDGYDPHSDCIRPLHLPPLYGTLAAAVPGIPQGSLLHYVDFKPDLIRIGFKPADADPCLFIHESGKMAMSLHVDDGVLAAPDDAAAERVYGPEGLGRNREITWGPLTSTLGIQFTVSYTPYARSVFMCQSDFALTILERANMLDANPVLTPAVPGRRYTKADCPKNDAEAAQLQQRGLDKKMYHTVVASLNYLVAITRDDMRFVQGKTAKFCANPGPDHFAALKHQLRFLRGTLDYGIEFKWSASDPAPADGPITIQAWSDSSFADDVDTGKTTLGYVVKANGATVSAYSKLSKRVDSCVNHSELNAFSAASASDAAPTDGSSLAFDVTAKSVAWLRGVKAALEGRDERDLPPTPIYVDNSGVESVINDVTLKPANKHVFRTIAANRERVHVDRLVYPVKVGTKDNLADLMTKQEPGLRESAEKLRKITGPMTAPPAQ